MSPEKFVEEWMVSYRLGETQSDFGRRLNLDRAMVSYRKNSYLKQGVKLPKLKLAKTGGGAKIDLKKLNSIISETKEVK